MNGIDKMSIACASAVDQLTDPTDCAEWRAMCRVDDGPGDGGPDGERAYRLAYLAGARHGATDESWEGDPLDEAREARWQAKLSGVDTVALATARGRHHGTDAAWLGWADAYEAGLPDDEIPARVLRPWLRSLAFWAARPVGEPDPPPAVRLPISGVGDPGPVPADLLDVPGFVGHVIAYNLATAKRPQPTLALAGALCLQAVLVGRKVRDEFGSRPNLQIICVAKTGKGKDGARSVNSEILLRSGLEQLDGPEEVASDAGLYRMLADQPCLLWQHDEFGRFLRLTGNAAKTPHLYAVPTALMKLYTSASKVYRPKGYGDAKANLTIDQPCLVLHAATTPDALFSALSSESVHDGFLGRCLIIEGDNKPIRQMVPERPIPAEIIEAAQYWAGFHPGDGNLKEQHPTPTVIQTTDDANKVFGWLADDAERYEEDGGRGSAIWTRAEQKARQLALVYACSANRDQPIIDWVAAEWACRLVCHLTRRMVYLCGIWVSTNEQESKQQKVYRIIKDAGGQIGQRELSRASQWLKARERQELLDGMVEAGMIRQEWVSKQKLAWQIV